MIDRDARNRLLDAIDAYMEDRVDGERFDVGAMDILRTTQDRTVHHILWWLEDALGEFLPRRIAVNRFGWKLCNRFRLLLASEAEVAETVERHWSIRQPLALATFFIMAYGIYCLAGEGTTLLLGWGLMLFGAAINIGLYCWRSRVWAKTEDCSRKPIDDGVLYETFPFDSLGEILALRRTVPGFACKKYRKEIAERDDRSIWSRWMDWEIRLFPQWLENGVAKIADTLLTIFLMPFLLIFGAPFLLLYMSLPETRCETCLRLPDGKETVCP